MGTSDLTPPTHRATIGYLTVKPGVLFTTIAPAGFRILAALHTVAHDLRVPLVITSACDGAHAGPNDPHHRGEAYDVRTHSLPEAVKDDLLAAVLLELSGHEEPIQAVSIGYATTLFYAQLEERGGENEHLHVQLRNGRTFPTVLRTEGSLA